MSNGIVNSSYALNMVCKERIPALSEREKQLLRTAMAKLLLHGAVDDAYKKWKKDSVKPKNCFKSRVLLWREILKRKVIDQCFSAISQKVLSDCIAGETALQEEKKKQDDTIQKAVEKLSNMDEMADFLITKPATLDQWNQARHEGKIGFSYEPVKGKFAGKSIVALPTYNGLPNLAPMNIPDECVAAILDRCQESGMIPDRKFNITIEKHSVSCVIFLT